MTGRIDEMRGVYAEEARVLLEEYGVLIQRWTVELEGRAWALQQTGPEFDPRGFPVDIPPFIECPQPTSPEHFIFLAHEVGHHALGHTRSDDTKPTWLKEHEAWLFAIQQMSRFQIPTEGDPYIMWFAGMRSQLVTSLENFELIPESILYYYLEGAERDEYRRRRSNDPPGRIVLDILSLSDV